jgi:carbon storage regulator
MLVLSRKENQSIVINGNIEVVVASIRGGKVRLAVEAPEDVLIHRKEVHVKLKPIRAIENHNSMNGGRK